MNDRTLNEALYLAAKLCRMFEGFRSKPYLCPAGYPTIGYGTCYYPNGKQVSLSDPPISQETADSYLIAELRKFLAQVFQLCPGLAQETPGRIAAILDFTYNLGAGRLKASTLRKRVNAKDWPSVRTELLKWVNGGGRVLPGLQRRRLAETLLI